MTSPPWKSQMIEIKSREGVVTEVFAPLLKFRWPLYAKTPTAALKKLTVLPKSTVQAILEHLYANVPVSRTNLPAFKTCKIVDKLPFESSYYNDLINLLHDTESCDFELIAENGEMTLPIHKYILATRSSYFRNLFKEDPGVESITMQRMNGDALTMWAKYIYTGDFETTTVSALPELIGSGYTYGLRDPAEIDYLAVYALQSSLNSENVESVREKATDLCLPEILELTDSIPLGTISE